MVHEAAMEDRHSSGWPWFLMGFEGVPALVDLTIEIATGVEGEVDRDIIPPLPGIQSMVPLG